MNLLRPLAYFLITLEVLMGVECDVTDKELVSGLDIENVQKNSSSLQTPVAEARKKQDKGGDMMSKILPMMMIPFMISTSIIPMMLMSLKFMLMKSALMGSIAVMLLLFNMFRGRNNDGGVFTHNVHQRELSAAHYGYTGDEEYGAYVNRRSIR